MEETKNKIKNKSGRAPISQKVEGLDTAEFGSEARSLVDIPDSCKKELAAAGLEGRWIDIVQLRKNQGYHKREWAPFKFECLMKSAKNPFASTEGQYEGYLIRAQLILAAKPVEAANRRRAYLKKRSEMQSNPEKAKVQEFQQFLNSSGVDAKLESWDDGDDKV